MKKIITGVVLSLIILFISAYYFIKFNPPLEIGTLASSSDHKSVVVGIGNKGFRNVKIVEVLVNNKEIPLTAKLQVSNALQGLILTDDYKSVEAKSFGFTNIDKAAIKIGTSQSERFEELDDGTASKSDEIYGVSVIHNEEINNVHIKYNYLGISFNRTVIINF